VERPQAAEEDRGVPLHPRTASAPRTPRAAVKPQTARPFLTGALPGERDAELGTERALKGPLLDTTPLRTSRVSSRALRRGRPAARNQAVLWRERDPENAAQPDRAARAAVLGRPAIR